MNHRKRIECDRMHLQLRLGSTKGLVWQASALSTFQKGVFILLIVVVAVRRLQAAQLVCRGFGIRMPRGCKSGYGKTVRRLVSN